MVSNSTYGVWLYSSSTVLHQLDQKIIYPHYDFKHLTKKYFEIGMKLNDFSIQLVKYCSNNNELTDNRVSDNNVSIYLKNSGENLLTGNRVLNSNGLGICLWNSAGNTLNNNTTSDNASIFLHNSCENKLVNKTVDRNNYGFWMN